MRLNVAEKANLAVRIKAGIGTGGIASMGLRTSRLRRRPLSLVRIKTAGDW